MEDSHNFKNRIIDIFEKYSAKIEDSPNFEYIQKYKKIKKFDDSDYHDIEFMPYSDNGVMSASSYNSLEQAKEVIDKLKKYPFYNKSKNFWINVIVNGVEVEKVDYKDV